MARRKRKQNASKPEVVKQKVPLAELLRMLEGKKLTCRLVIVQWCGTDPKAPGFEIQWGWNDAAAVEKWLRENWVYFTSDEAAADRAGYRPFETAAAFADVRNSHSLETLPAEVRRALFLKAAFDIFTAQMTGHLEPDDGGVDFGWQDEQGKLYMSPVPPWAWARRIPLQEGWWTGWVDWIRKGPQKSEWATLVPP